MYALRTLYNEEYGASWLSLPLDQSRWYLLAVVWLLFELSIFRDSQFSAPWVYSVVMFAIGLIYFIWMLVTRPKVLQTAPVEGSALVN